jgi:hypothetical protein
MLTVTARKKDFHQDDFDTYLYGTVKYNKESEQAIIEFDEHLNVILNQFNTLFKCLSF